MDWREKSKCRQWLKRLSVFLYSPALWREWGGNWQRASVAGDAEGWVGSQPVQPQAVSWAAPPAQGIRHLPGAGAGRDIRAVGSWTLSLLHFILSPLSYSCQWQSHRHSPFPAWGVLPGLFVNPKNMLSHWAGVMPPRGVLLGCLPKHCYSPTCLWYCPEMPLSVWNRG